MNPPAIGKWALVILGLFLIVLGAIQALHLTFDFQHIVLGVMLIAMGIFILIGK